MLTKDQQDLIENSLWIVNTALKKQHSQHNEDLRQSAILLLCKCVEQYDSSKGVKWSTYAYRRIYFYVMKENIKAQKYKSKIVSLNEVINEDGDTLDEVIVGDDGSRFEDELMIKDIKKVCNNKEKKIVDMRKEGYKLAEIANEMNLCTSSIYSKLKKVKDKARKIKTK